MKAMHYRVGHLSRGGICALERRLDKDQMAGCDKLNKCTDNKQCSVSADGIQLPWLTLLI